MRYAASSFLGMAIGLSSQAAAQSCVNLQCFQVTCLGSATTSISGTVYAPNGADPIPNVLVYVPNGTVEPFVDGPADDTEASLVTGSPLVSTTTAANGAFTLTDVPAGTGFPLVLQAGRWRRQLTVPSVTSCVNTPVSNFNPPQDVFARFPQTQVEGDIPKMALATGGVDAVECSLRKIGIADTEFTDYTVNATGLSEPGRISLFEGAGNSGAKAGGTVHSESQLVGSTSATIAGSLLGNYNVLLLPCQGTFGYTWRGRADFCHASQRYLSRSGCRHRRGRHLAGRCEQRLDRLRRSDDRHQFFERHDAGAMAAGYRGDHYARPGGDELAIQRPDRH
ncbi:MAG: hypothetical protein ABSA78_20995 [Candidatus Sulfotelmatobacter sp.]